MVNLALREVSNFRVRYGALRERRTRLVTKLNVGAKRQTEGYVLPLGRGLQLRRAVSRPLRVALVDTITCHPKTRNNAGSVPVTVGEHRELGEQFIESVCNRGDVLTRWLHDHDAHERRGDRGDTSIV